MSNPNPKPTPPAEHECCESGCNPCVWDNYYAKLKKWRFAQAKIKSEQEDKK